MLPLEIQRNSAITRLWHSPTFMTWASLATRSMNLVLLIPFILRQFSPAEISLWYLFSTVISLNLMIDLGLGVTFSRFIAYAMGGANGTDTTEKPVDRAHKSGPNQSYLLKVVGTQQILFAWLTGLVFLLLVVGGTLSVYRPIHFLENPDQGWMAWGIVIVATTVTFRGNAYTTYLQGINRIAEFRRYETFFSLAAILTSVLMLYFNTGLVGLVAVNQLWNIVSVLRNRWMCYQYNEGVFVSGQSFKFDQTILKEIWPAAWRSGIGVLMSYGLIQSSSLIYAQSNQVEQVSAYLFAMRIMQIIITFAQAPFYSKLPLMARLYAQDDRQQIIEVAQKGMQRAHWTFVAGFVGVALLAEPVMQLIGSNIHFIDQRLWAIMGIAFFVERYGAMHLQLYSITNHIVWHIANGLTGLIYIILALIAYPMLGVLAFPLSMLAAYLGFYSWYSTLKSYAAFKLNFITFESKQLVIPSLILLVIAMNSIFHTIKI
ncbi:lipopolysaccharide biosynthesis protein [Larkinella sp.]|uniref:lipopolysaccharide biosynthesis protein n=1 Tax=Larkinella sp. TaxID=2034517 RepID=UPI003BACFFE5